MVGDDGFFGGGVSDGAAGAGAAELSSGTRKVSGSAAACFAALFLADLRRVVVGAADT